jgi:hypothetical protein
VHLRLRPVQRTNDSQGGSDMWPFVDLLANRLATPSQSSIGHTAF